MRKPATNPKPSPKAKAPAKPKRERGAPSIFTKALADKICDRLAGGQSLREICETKGMPGKTTVLRWLRDNDNFRSQYVQAREDQGESSADSVEYTAQQVALGKISAEVGRVVIDAHKWSAGKRAPKKYGDKLDVAHQGVINIIMSEEDKGVM